MSPLLALAAVAVLVAAAAMCGVAWQRSQGRVRRTSGEDVVDAAALGVHGLGERATLVQFSTELCARCPQVRRMLAGFEADGVRRVEVDLTRRPDLARRFHVMQTPTTLVVDGAGRIRARFGGVPVRAAVAHELSQLIGEPAHA